MALGDSILKLSLSKRYQISFVYKKTEFSCDPVEAGLFVLKNPNCASKMAKSYNLWQSENDSSQLVADLKLSVPFEYLMLSVLL